MTQKTDWYIYEGKGEQRHRIELPEAPPWRIFDRAAKEQHGPGFQVGDEELRQGRVSCPICGVEFTLRPAGNRWTVAE
ncbi:MAG: hypothetical protein HGA87_07005 [Desulfobulbaceae bacterium]|nr:hypothetical protein [Desulfobulbaceae bacterium]